MVDIATLIQFLIEGNYLGFLQAVYVSAFVSIDVFYGMLLMLFTSPLYIRTKSLMLLVIIWILLGGFFITLMPLVAGLGLFLIIMALASVLLKLFLTVRG